MAQSEKKLILHVIKGLGRGGAERLLVNSVQAHARHHEVHVIYFLTLKDQLESELIKAGATVHLLPAQQPLAIFFRLPALIRLIRKLKPSLIHAHLPLAAFQAAIASIFTGVQLIYTEHNLPSRYKWPTRILHHYTLWRATHILAVSNAVKEHLQLHFNAGGKVVVMENGIDPELFFAGNFNRIELRKTLDLPETKMIIGTMAVFTHQKRLDRWVQICQQIHTLFPETFFILAGHGPLIDELKLQAKSLLDQKVLIFTDRTEVPEQWMAAMDIYLMTSDYEGMPVALLEAMSLEIPVVVPAVGGIPSVVNHGVSGFLYQPEDIQAAVEFVSRLLPDSGLRKAVGAAGRETILKRFNLGRMVAHLEEIYSGYLDQRVTSDV